MKDEQEEESKVTPAMREKLKDWCKDMDWDFSEPPEETQPGLFE